jgi:hypothetical protein
LVSSAISDDDQSWRLDWMEYRMYYVISAETITYYIPGNALTYLYFSPFFEYHFNISFEINYTSISFLKRVFLCLYAIGLRKCLRIFPDKIYYTSTPQQVWDYEEKTKQIRKVSSMDRAIGSWKVDDMTDTEESQFNEAELQKQHRVKLDKQIDSLQHQLKDQQQMLTDQQQLLVQILSKLER